MPQYNLSLCQRSATTCKFFAPLKQHTDDSLQDAERITWPEATALRANPLPPLIQSPAKGLDERDPPRHHNAISA